MAARKLPEFTTAFGWYRSVRILGEGGSGRVYAAEGEDRLTYAVKLLSADASREKSRRFKNEILFGARTRHKNIVPITDHGTWNVAVDFPIQPFYVMPQYGTTLRQAITDGLQPENAIRVFAQILDGVEAAHLLDVVHRDLKPENILLDGSGTPLVADFGIARFSADLLATLVDTQPTTRLANFVYAAPEQRRAGGTVDARTDIFALGLMLNELFTGHVPLGTAFASVASRAPQFAFVDELVAEMIAQKLEDRPASIGVVKGKLIARQQEFVGQQRLDAARATVVSAAAVDDPIAGNPVEVRSGDWQGHQLVFRLNQAPPSAWTRVVTETINGAEFFSNYPPDSIHFSGDVAYWPASPETAQIQINQFKDRVAHANRQYITGLTREAERKEQEVRRRLQEKILDEEERLRVARTLKF